MLSFIPTFDAVPSERQLLEGATPSQAQISDGKQPFFIFIVDRSGSMEGERIRMAVKALLLFLQSLPFGCNFEIVSFGSKFDSLSPSGFEYTEQNLQHAKSKVSKFTADYGGTEIWQPLN
mmetsp:Transcript_45379/g.33169  ORF Transcript_45379/g.33169 Transcript_45379/m.33169 type:complete len:120 (+) Transcript_45379:377-736(+)